MSAIAYSTLRTVFWGTGIVFFLAKFINLHNANTQGLWVELCQQVETGRCQSGAYSTCMVLTSCY